MPALTVANLLAWSIQVAAIVLVGGITVRAVRLQSPRVRLACFRVLLVACLVLPFVQPLQLGPDDPELKSVASNVKRMASATPGLQVGTDQSGARDSGWPLRF